MPTEKSSQNVYTRFLASSLGQFLSWPFRKGAEWVRRFQSWVKNLFNKEKAQAKTPIQDDKIVTPVTKNAVTSQPEAPVGPEVDTPVSVVKDNTVTPVIAATNPTIEPTPSFKPVSPPSPVILPSPPLAPARPQQKQIDAIFEDIELRNYLPESTIKSLKEEQDQAELIKTLENVAKQQIELDGIKRVIQEARMVGKKDLIIREEALDRLEKAAPMPLATDLEKELVTQLFALEGLLNNLEPMTATRQQAIKTRVRKLGDLIVQTKRLLNNTFISDTTLELGPPSDSSDSTIDKKPKRK